MSAGLSPSVSYEETVPGLSPGFWWWPAIPTFLDLQTCHSHLCLHHQMLVCFHVHISSSFKDANCIELGASLIRAWPHFNLGIAWLGFPNGSDSKESACDAGDLVRSLGLEDPLEKEVATYSSILAWRIPWQRSLVGYSPLGHKEFDTTEHLNNNNTTICFPSHYKGMCIRLENSESCFKFTLRFHHMKEPLVHFFETKIAS